MEVGLLEAQRVFSEYARVLERDLLEARHPARVDSLPCAKAIIESAIRTAVRYLAQSGQLTREFREYFEIAYTSLADYLDGELVDLVHEYRESAERLTTIAARDKPSTSAWSALVSSSPLAAEVARATAGEADRLRHEFRDLLDTLTDPPASIA